MAPVAAKKLLDFVIDGVAMQAEDGQTVIQAARATVTAVS